MYRPSRCLPIVNSTAVTAAPSQTSRQATLASGTTLNKSAKSTVTTANESAKLMTCQSTAPPGKVSANTVPNALSAALSTSETSSKKATPSTMVKEKKRSFSLP